MTVEYGFRANLLPVWSSVRQQQPQPPAVQILTPELEALQRRREWEDTIEPPDHMSHLSGITPTLR